MHIRERERERAKSMVSLQENREKGRKGRKGIEGFKTIQFPEFSQGIGPHSMDTLRYT